MLNNFSSESLIEKLEERSSNNRLYIKSEEKLIEDEIEEMSQYIKNKLLMGIDIFHIQLPDSLLELKKIIFSILNNTQRKPEDNIVLRQYLISYPEFIDHLKLKEEITDSKDLLLKISEHLKKEEIEKDKVIFYNGQLGKTFYLILEGEVSVLIPYEFKTKITDKQLFEYHI